MGLDKLTSAPKQLLRFLDRNPLQLWNLWFHFAGQLALPFFLGGGFDDDLAVVPRVLLAAVDVCPRLVEDD